MAKKQKGSKQTKINDEPALVIRPRLPQIPGIFDIPADTCIASHAPHAHIPEHLHDHFFHMHIRYGFELPVQTLDGIEAASLRVAMAVNRLHRVDCNPVFVARGEGSTGVCLKIGGQDVHWVHDEEVGEIATELFGATGRTLADEFYFAGFSTSDLAERKLHRYSREDLKRAIGRGLVADQHFQATWREPRKEPIMPYDVIIFLGDDSTNYHTFFRLPVVVPIGAC